MPLLSFWQNVAKNAKAIQQLILCLPSELSSSLKKTAEAPAVIKFVYDKRIVGCPGGAGDEHDVVWFWLEKGKQHECRVCSQYFKGTFGFSLIG